MYSIVQINSKYTSALMYLTTNDNAKDFAGYSFPIVRDDTNVFFEAKMAVKAENQNQSWAQRWADDVLNRRKGPIEMDCNETLRRYFLGLARLEKYLQRKDNGE